MTALEIINDVKEHRCSFVDENELAVIAGDERTRFTSILVRCGNGRFIASAQDTAHIIACIEKSGIDYVRDASIYTSR
jgi:hypothetical protein